MFFTQDDFRQIENWLYNRTAKDSDFPQADPIRGGEQIPILQDGKNKIMSLNSFIKEISTRELKDFYNVSADTGCYCLTLKQAIAAVPLKQRKLGLVITFCNENGNWCIYQFSGQSLNQWTSLKNWKSLIQEALEELLYYPDEEDITGIRIGNKNYLKFKDRDYDPANFSGKGKIILRKNFVGTPACSLDDEDHQINLLTQDMIDQKNTVYVVQYDFDLDGGVISIPQGSTLWLQGGSINNGTVYLQDTPILGAFEFADMGSSLRLFGSFKTGQVMTFRNQDADRQELRWYNGTEWLLLLDITDYRELKQIIQDLIDKHNKDISDLRKYIDTQVLDINNKISDVSDKFDNLNSTVTNISNRVNSLSNFINNIGETINTYIQDYLSTHVLGVTSIIVNGQVYTPGSDGSVTLPDYPDAGGGTADRVKGTLTFTGGAEGSYNGSSDVTVHIPQGGSSGIEAKETLTVKQGDTTLGTYNGTEAVTINIPESSGGGASGGTADKVAHKLKFTGAITADYDGSEEVTVHIPSAPQLEILGVAEVSRSSTVSNDWSVKWIHTINPYYLLSLVFFAGRPSIRVQISGYDYSGEFAATGKPNTEDKPTVITAIPQIIYNGGASATSTSAISQKGAATSIYAQTNGGVVSMIALRKDNKDNDTSSTDGFMAQSERFQGVVKFSILLIGTRNMKS